MRWMSVPAIASDPPLEPTHHNAVQLGEMADEFRRSKHWPFFLLLCARVRRENTEATANPDAAIRALATIAAMEMLPARVEQMIRARHNAQVQEELRRRIKAEGQVSEYAARNRSSAGGSV